LSLVMVVSLAAVVVSLTWAPLLVLPLAAGIVVWHGRRVPREVGITVGALCIAIVLFWPAVSGRIVQQGLASSAGQGVVIPQTFEARLDHWQRYFLPALADHVWLGTGTVIPSIVPTPLTDYVDNEYLRDAFRAGVVGLMLLFVMLLAIALTGWRSRRAAGSDPMRRSLGSTCLALVVFLALVGVTAEYLFFGGVSQEFAMLVGLLAAHDRVEALATQRSARRSPITTRSPA
jgi:O-antigen ligase